MELTTGSILNQRYRIVKVLGRGGFGTVYRAWDLNLSRTCAVKENTDTSVDATRQFSREATFLANLHHPNLPRVTDHFSLPGQGQYLVMDFIEGDDLQAMLASTGSALPEGQVLRWMVQVLSALEYLHSQTPPIIHRDIKPANIRITPQGQAVLVDFGIAKAFDSSSKTTHGARAVTPGYSPQEQYGSGRTDARSDLYALGATLYTLLTGQAPIESVQRTIGEQLPPPRSLNPAISPAVEAAILKAMAPAPAERFQAAAEMRSELFSRQPASAPISAPGVGRTIIQPASTPPAAASQPASQPHKQRLPWGWLSAAAGLVLFVIFAPVLWRIFAAGPEELSPTAIPVANQAPATSSSTALVEPATATLPPPTETSAPTSVTATAAPSPTITPTPTPVFGAIQFCKDRDCSRGPGAVYPEGIKDIFFMWSYQNMRPGTSYGRRWYVNGGLYLDYKCTWKAGWPVDGMFVQKVYDHNLGLAPGEWLLETYVEDQLQAIARFTVRGEPRMEKFLNYTCSDKTPAIP